MGANYRPPDRQIPARRPTLATELTSLPLFVLLMFVHAAIEFLCRAPQHSALVCDPKPTVMSEINAAKNQSMEEMDILERRVNELIALTEQLSRENKALRTQQENWSVERAKLIEKNELAKSRVESMIGRLRTLENS